MTLATNLRSNLRRKPLKVGPAHVDGVVADRVKPHGPNYLRSGLGSPVLPSEVAAQRIPSGARMHGPNRGARSQNGTQVSF